MARTTPRTPPSAPLSALSADACCAAPAVDPALPNGPVLDALHQALAQQAVADAHGHPLLRCEALTESARCLAAGHAYAASEACLVLALAAARQLPASQDQQADLLCALAEVCCNAAELADARHGQAVTGTTLCAASTLADSHAGRAQHAQACAWAEQAAQAARQVSDPQWQAQVLLRAADVLERSGDLDGAVDLQRQALAIHEPPTHTGARSAWTTTGPQHPAPRQRM